MQPVFGGLRLGRTHLLHAIATTRRSVPSLDIRYVRAAELAASSRSRPGGSKTTRSRYLDAKMLFVDDVRLPDAGAIQAEFLHVSPPCTTTAGSWSFRRPRALLPGRPGQPPRPAERAWSRTVERYRRHSLTRLLTVAPARTAISPQPPGSRIRHPRHTDPATHRPRSPSRPPTWRYVRMPVTGNPSSCAHHRSAH
jgi:hypothetical protein